MTDTQDPAPGFRAELNAALDVMAPQIIGLEDLPNARLSGELTNKIAAGLEVRMVRRGLIKDVLQALDVVLEKLALLKAHGYPALPLLDIDEQIGAELQTERAAFDAALAIFKVQLRASRIKANLGEAVPKTGT